MQRAVRWMSSAGGAAASKEYEDKIGEKKNEKKKSDVPLGMLKADGSSKRFYGSAGVDRVTVDDPRSGAPITAFCLTLDGRQVRTPANKLLTLPNENMAMAIALEFDVQDLYIQPFTMPMTTLATTAIDQLTKPAVRKHSIEGMMRVFQSDLLSLRSNKPPELVQLEKEAWDVVTDWVSAKYKHPVGVSLGEDDSWLLQSHPQELIDAVESDLTSRHEWRLTALDQVTGSTGSLMLSLALCEGNIDAEDAYKAARVHEQYQIDLWGRVEASGMGGHDIDEADMKARLAAAHLYHRLLPAHWH
mmetsp:Transcript_40733/g.101898  ORF Transcript_40733/g.101898 Transcript_40733/m.101898 type:complete len:302 (+) Transcript_40733:2-907(+)